MQKLSALLGALMLQGCSMVHNGHVPYASNPPDLNYLPIGVPLLLGGHGTGIPLTDNISLTAAHVARYDYSDVIAYHPDCDLALIRANNSNKQKLPLGLIYKNQPITNYGYGIFGVQVSAKGEYHLDLVQENDKCQYSLGTAPQKSGMSGGAVLNEKNELVGVIQSIGFKAPQLKGYPEPYVLDRYSYFISINLVKDWIFEHAPELETPNAKALK